MKKEKFKKFIIKSMWFILWTILLFISMNAVCQGFEFVMTDTNSMLGVILLISSKYMFDVCLYIYSYKIYFGKYNWYKFFRDREKQQQKQNNFDWQEYCNSLKTKK